MSDFTQHGKSAVLLSLFISATHLLCAQSEVHKSDAWVVDNNVSRVEYSNGYTLISGGFSSIGQYTGGAVFTNTTTGTSIDSSMTGTYIIKELNNSRLKIYIEKETIIHDDDSGMDYVAKVKATLYFNR